MSHTDPGKRHDFVLLFDVVNGNPNGDPDAGNMPRTDAETMHGLVTDVCIKRKIRNYAAGVLGKEIFIQSEVALNTLYYQKFREARDANGDLVGEPVEVVLTADKALAAFLDKEDSEFAAWLRETDVEGLDYVEDNGTVRYLGTDKTAVDFTKSFLSDEDPSGELKKALKALAVALAKASKDRRPPSKGAQEIVKFDLCGKYFDMRMFGAVLTAGTNAGQVRGPVQITFGTSIDQIRPIEMSITRVAITKPSDQARKKTEMGRKSIVPYALYRAHGFYNPMLAHVKQPDGSFKYLVSENDLKDLWESLEFMFEHDRSAARPEMNTRGLYVFTHDCEKGNAAAHKLFEKVTVPKKGGLPQSFEDYRAGIAVPIDGAVEGFSGVSLKRLVHDAV